MSPELLFVYAGKLAMTGLRRQTRPVEVAA